MLSLLHAVHDQTSHRIKDIEKARIFQKIALDPGITRKRIVAELKLRPTSVSNVVSELINQHMVYEGELQNNGRKGRPEISLYMNPNYLVSIAVYVVSKQLKGVLLNITGEILAENSINVSLQMGNDDFLRLLIDLIEPLRQAKPLGSEFAGVGLSFFGNFNKIKQELIFSMRWPNIKYFSFKQLSDRLGCEVLISTSLEAKLNDLLMNEPQYRNGGTLLYHWGYGIGATYAMNGVVLESTPGYIMEAGHVAVDLNNEQVCRCGNIGCLETEAALWALLPKLAKDYDGVPENENEFRSYYLEHHLGQSEIIRHAAKAFALSLASLYQILHPERMILLSPFLMDEQIYGYVQQQFYLRTSPHTHDDAKFILLPPEFRGEIYGSTSPLFKKRFQKELIVHD